MDARAKKIQDAVDQSEKDKNQAKALLAQYEAQLREAEGEAENIIRAARESAKQEADRIIAESTAQAKFIMDAAHRRVETEERASLGRFKAEAADLVVAASGRLLGRELKTEDNRRYAGMILDEIGKN
jgi:F-type H+-transporting ATPase subunit b